MLGWETKNGGAKRYIGRQYKPGKFLLTVSNASEGSRPKTDWITYRWSAAQSEGFFSLEKKTVKGLYGSKSKYWRECTLSLTSSPLSAQRNPSATNTDVHLSALKQMEDRQRAALRTMSKFGYVPTKKYDSDGLIKKLEASSAT